MGHRRRRVGFAARWLAAVAGVSLMGAVLVAPASAEDAPAPASDAAAAQWIADPSVDLRLSSDALSMAVQPDGKILVGGQFTRADGEDRGGLARFHPDGTLDTTFVPGVTGWVFSLAVQPDGRILVGGQFQEIGQTEYRNIARLNPDGSVDPSFATWAQQSVDAIALQSDGMILIGGRFLEVNGVRRVALARLTPNGELDTFFKPIVAGDVRGIVIQPDGMIVAGGSFAFTSWESRRGVARFDSEGDVDPTFVGPGDVTNLDVRAIALDAQGRIVLGSTIRTGSSPGLMRLTSDGQVDSSFAVTVWPSEAGFGTVSAVSILGNGRIAFGGLFISVDGRLRMGLAMVESDGALVESFHPVVKSSPTTIGQPRALLPESSAGFLVAGQFETVAGEPRRGFARLIEVSPPGVPRSVSASPGDGEAVVSWLDPSSTGGSPITDVEVSVDGGATWETFTPPTVSAPGFLSGLVNGKSYEVSLRAVNAYGPGEASSPVTVTPRTVPGAPTDLRAVSGDGQGTIAFDAPSDGGAAITNYEFALDGGAWVPLAPAVTSSPVTITGLTNGTVYQVALRAVNAAGSGAASEPVEVAPQAPAPGAPTITAAEPRNRAAVLSFTPPSSGGAPTNYEYALNGGAWVAFSPASTSSPVTITGLTNDVEYAVALRAVTSAGAGAASNVVSVRPEAAEPSAPRDLVASPGDGEITVRFVAGSPGGSAIANYEFSLNNGSTWTAFAPAVTGSPVRITGLVNGTEYRVRLRAVNAAGAGEASAAVTVTPRSVPGAPTNLVAQPGNGRATITFTPGGNAGSPITNYEYQVDQGSWTPLVPADPRSPVTVTGLANGQVLSIRLRAVNAQGSGTPSLPVSVVPRTVPDAPVLTAAVPGPQSAVVSFVQDWNGGSAVTNYQYAIDAGSWTPVSPATTSSPITITGLADGKAVAVRLRAVNAAGPGEASAPMVVTPTPRPKPEAPGAPQNVRASAGDGQVLVTWQPPTSGGSSPITRYSVATQPGGKTCEPVSPSVLACLVEGLTNGVAYSFTVTASNVVGVGPASARTPEVRPHPDRPESILITGQRGGLPKDANRVFVIGIAPGLSGVVVRPMVKLPGQSEYQAGVASRTISPSGDFDWSRRTGKKVYVYFVTSDGTRSNMVSIPARPRR